MTGPDLATRQLVIDRAGRKCERCGQPGEQMITAGAGDQAVALGQFLAVALHSLGAEQFRTQHGFGFQPAMGGPP